MANSVERWVGYELKRAQHALRLRMDAALRDVGLTTPQYAVLSQLATAPGLSSAELARRAFVTPQTMNDIVTKLEAAGLLERRPHPTHGRVREARPTARGLDALGRARPLVEAIETRMLAGLHDDDRPRLLDTLRRCADALERDD